MGLLGAESFVQSPRDAVTFNESLGGRERAGHTTVKSEVERSMLAYTQKARLLMSTSVPEGFNNSSRFLHQKAFFSPVTWSQSVNTLPPQGYALDYSFPHFKEREDLLGLGRREQPEKSAVKLFVGKEHEQSTRAAANENRTSPTKPMGRRKKKSRRSISVTSVQTDKSRGKMSMATINDDRLSLLSVGTKDTVPASVTTSYCLALDAGSGNAMGSEMSGPVLVAESRGYENRSAKLQHGAFSVGRMFPPRNTHQKLQSVEDDRSRKRNRFRNQNPPSYFLVGKSESLPNINDAGKDNFTMTHNNVEGVNAASRTNGIEEEIVNPLGMLSTNTNMDNPIVGNGCQHDHTTIASSANASLSQQGAAQSHAHGEHGSSASQKAITVQDTDDIGSISGEVKLKRGRKRAVVQPSVVNLFPGP